MARKASSNKGTARKKAIHAKRKSASTKRGAGSGDGGRAGPTKGRRKASGKRKAPETVKKAAAKKTPAGVGRKVPAGGKARAAAGGARKRRGPDADNLVSDLVFQDHASEDLLAVQLLEEIEYRHGVDVASLDLRIRQGTALARGAVSDVDELEAVRETMQDCGGISDLTFLVQVAPDRREQDRDRARGIQESMEAEPDLAEENVMVACVGRKAIVRGIVATQLQKVKAGLLALRRGEVSRVVNRLVVGAPK